MAAKVACARSIFDIFHKRLLLSTISVHNGCNGRHFVSFSQTFLSPQPPKKPAGAFFKFYNESTPEIIKKHPNATIGERSKVASQMWRELDPEVKSKLKLAAQEEQQNYRIKYLAFLDGLSDQERVQLKQQKQAKRKARVHRQHKMELKKFGRPKYPPNAYMLFVRSSRLERGSAHPTEFIKGLVEYWKKMPQEEKDIYTEDAKAEREKYNQEMLEWEDRMREMGREDLIRRKSQKRARKVTSTRAKKKTRATGKKTTKAAKKTTKSTRVKSSSSTSAATVSAKATSPAKVTKKASTSSGTRKKKTISKTAEE